VHRLEQLPLSLLPAHSKAWPLHHPTVINNWQLPSLLFFSTWTTALREMSRNHQAHMSDKQAKRLSLSSWVRFKPSIYGKSWRPCAKSPVTDIESSENNLDSGLLRESRFGSQCKYCKKLRNQVIISFQYIHRLYLFYNKHWDIYRKQTNTQIRAKFYPSFHT